MTVSEQGKANSPNIIQILQAHLKDLTHLLESVDSDEYTTRDDNMMSGSIGGHVRHLVAHIQILLESFFSAETGEKMIHYDRRERGTPMENDPKIAIRDIHELCQQLQLVHPKMYAMPIAISHIVNGKTQDSLQVSSNLERELMFTFHHLLHHFAMISIRMKILGKDIPSDFGHAPATIAEASRTESL